ncbi:DNA-binding transcriptional regulator, AcrR family [Paenimyroides ummariense]|uniref:DNA-binding transcriptional regulator, AcrR family n=1 Tax=Paenimyroides ummariense TaxID=913024 RepID=A0A1I4X5C6_9FLAO|nr:TetR/AcrR family transcriptional regulator [Paenimyroides ummariense]SFN21191.1 DNA-binding transcriptional regulator, AcrR family [Paenimyroides ummariense]
MTTKEKILDTARILFNEQGIRSTTTRHIAASMPISPGNLHYHFRHTEDIVIALFEQLKKKYDKMMEEVQELSLTQLDDLVPVFDILYDQINNYRFLFIHFVEISSWIPEIKKDYQQLLLRREEQFKNWLDALTKQGVIVNLADKTREGIIKKLFIVGDFWISHNALYKQYTGDEARQDFVSTLRSVLSPYVNTTKAK